ncbi:hypothetical protein V5F77_19035 [Xanthobacter sp. DSM 24535]|uniref:hypothetical protein n=1 Tax=Roseixanthobacter psychrophilus TaxID=3119917 RepID=UPI003726A971
MTVPPPPEHSARPGRFHPLLVVLALLFLVEAWLWRHLAPAVQWCADRLPFAAFKATISRWAHRLPPYGAFFLFLIPLLLVEPLYIVALWAFSHHHWVLGTVAVLLEKLVGVALMAFLFDVCRAQLLSIGWFAWLFNWLVRIKTWAEAEVEPVKLRVHALMARIRAALPADGGFWQRVRALRRRAFSRS